MYTQILSFIITSLISSVSLSVYANNDLAGTWQGTLGKNKIRVCFNEYGTGSYYYLRYLTPIRLEETDNHWEESKQTGYWQFNHISRHTVSGVWYKKEWIEDQNIKHSGDNPKGHQGKSIPLKLTRQVSSGGRDDCASDAYNLPLETLPKLIRGAWQQFNSIEYRELDYATDISLEFKGSQQGIPVINQWLLQKVTNRSQLDHTFDTRRRMLAYFGDLFTDETGAEPTFINQDWLSVKFYRWLAGYGSDGISLSFISFSLADGKLFHPWQWFIDGASPDQMQHQLPQALRAKLFANTKAFEECDNSDGSGDYHLTLHPTGIKFWESADGSGCENEFTLSPKEAMPFATKWGKTQLKLMDSRLN